MVDSEYVRGFDPGFTNISRVTDLSGKDISYTLENGKVLLQNYSLKDNYLKVILPEKLSPGESYGLIIYFSTKFPESYAGDMAFVKCFCMEIWVVSI